MADGGDEGLLLAAHARGHDGAFARLLAAWRAPVYAYLVRSGLDAATRDDLFQEIFLKVHGAAAAYQPSRPLKPWIFTIVANTVRSHFRRRAPVEVDLGALDTADGRPDAEREVAARETVAWLEGAIRSLPLAQREVLILAGIEGLAMAEVAQALGIPVNTVKTHLRRARLELARALAARNAPPGKDDDRDA